MVRFLSLFTVLTLALLSARAAEGGHAHGGAGSGRSAELGANAVFDAKGVLWAVHKVSGHIAVSRSEDRGRAWSNPVLVTAAAEPTDAGGDARPKIALGARGEIYLTWTRPMTKPYTGEIRFSRSLDGGRTFSPAEVVHRDRQEITHRFDTLAVNASGQVFVVWIDKRDLETKDTAAAANRNRGAAVYFAVSDDRGATFRGDFKAADNCCECCRIALVTREDGSVVAMWRHIFPPNIRDHATAVLFPDGRAGAVQRASFEDWKIDACPHHGPSLASDAQGRLHAVWFSAAPEKRGVYYGRPHESGVDALRRMGSNVAAHADVATDGESVAVAWKTFADGRSRLRGALSPDGGATWREFDLASTGGASDHPCVIVWDHRFYVFWNTAQTPLSVTEFQ